MSDTETKKAAPVSAARRAVEKIAFERDMLPEFKPGVRPAHLPQAVVPPVHNPKFALFARAQVVNQWPTGHEMTDQEFDAAIAASEKASVYR